MAEEEEIVAEITWLLRRMVDEGELELASRRGTLALASPLMFLLERDADASVSDWLLDNREVVELYLDEDQLRERLRPVLARIAGKEPPTCHHPALAEAILDAPDDPQAWLVYADWLEEQGDPRGELAAIQRGRAEAPEDATLARAESSLLARYRRHFFGDLFGRFESPDPVAPLTPMRNGFIDRATVATADDLAKLLSLESARFLRALVVPCHSLDALDALLSTRSLPRTLTSLELGGTDSHAGVDGRLDACRATRGLERLERLVLRGKRLDIGLLASARCLRYLQVQAPVLGGLSDATFTSLVSLEDLDVEARTEAAFAALRPLFASPPSSLRRLRLRRAVSPSELDELLGSKIVRGLRVLDLRGESLGDDIAAVLLARRAALEHLEILDLRGSAFTAVVEEEIARLVAEVRLAGWWANDDDGRAAQEEEEEEDEDGDEEDDEHYDGITE